MTCIWKQVIRKLNRGFGGVGLHHWVAAESRRNGHLVRPYERRLSLRLFRLGFFERRMDFVGRRALHWHAGSGDSCYYGREDGYFGNAGGGLIKRQVGTDQVCKLAKGKRQVGKACPVQRG